MKTTNALLDIENPQYGHDLGQVWGMIGRNVNHPAYDEFLPDVWEYHALWNSMLLNFGENGLTEEEAVALPETDEGLRTFDKWNSLRETTADILARVELEFSIYGWKEEDFDDSDLVRQAIMGGMKAATQLARAEGITEPIGDIA